MACSGIATSPNACVTASPQSQSRRTDADSTPTPVMVVSFFFDAGETVRKIGVARFYVALIPPLSLSR